MYRPRGAAAAAASSSEAGEEQNDCQVFKNKTKQNRISKAVLEEGCKGQAVCW